MTNQRHAISLLPFLCLAAPAAAFDTLSLATGSGSDDVRFELGPGPGAVRVYGVSGVGSGTLYTGITEIQLDTNAGSDKVTVLGALVADMDFDFDTGTDSDQVFFQFHVPASATLVRARLRVDSGTGGDQIVHEIVNSAPTFLLDTAATMQSGGDVMVVKLDSQALSVRRLGVWIDADLGAEADVLDVEVKSSARTAQFSVADQPSTEDESVTIVWDQTPRPGSVVGNFDLRSGSVSADLKGEGSLFRTVGQIVGGANDDDITLKVDGRLIATDLVLEGGSGNDSIELLVGLDLTGDPLLSGGFGDDYLKLIIERDQFTNQGIPTIDGGPGSDICDAPGVIANVISCEG